MNINNIELKNFKVHSFLSFDIKGNCLLYGENGVGKSSIFEALYSNLYHNKRIKKNIDIREKYKNRNHKDKSLEVKINFDNGSSLLRLDNELKNLELINNTNIFMANERILNNLVENDFYKVLSQSLIEHFPKLKELLVYETFKRAINRNEIKEEEIKPYLTEFNIAFKKLFNEHINKDDINNILKEGFNENFKIDFDIADSYKDEFKFYYPKITLKIDDLDHENDLYNYFNEAKLKLISISIFLYLIKKNQNPSSNLNLLILDDFLTSLDMSNRKLIIQYIFDNFTNYQKIIFTHNIHFSNLIQNLLKSRDETNDWELKNIFSRIIDSNLESIIYNKESNYILIAESNLKNDNISIAGHILRKEFERIIEELRIINGVGAKEKLSNTIDEILKGNDSTDINRSKLIKLLKKAKFYQDIVMHPASHEVYSSDFTTKEVNGAIIVLKELNKYINSLTKISK